MKSCDKGEEDPPVPISNTEVKLFSAEDTWRAAARENRSLQVKKREQLQKGLLFSYADKVGTYFLDIYVFRIYFLLEDLYFFTLKYKTIHKVKNSWYYLWYYFKNKFFLNLKR